MSEPDPDSLQARLFVALQYLLPQHLLSQLVHWATRSRVRWVKNALIDNFVVNFHPDMSDAVQSQPLEFASFNEFFTRALRADARPPDPDPNTLVSPVDGTISQAAATKISATGASSLTADGGNIDLSGASNKFVGTVTASGTNITLDDSVALTADLDAVGAASLTTAKALDVSGTIGAGLTTDALDGKTKFGATTVGTTLDVTSTGSVTSTTAGILIVDGEKTTKRNANVTVNGVVGALIK